MLTVTYRKGVVRLAHVWFYENEDLSKIKSDLIFLHGLNEVPVCLGKTKKHIYAQNTVIKDLTVSEEEIWNTLGKHLRAYIKRNIKENVSIRFYDATSLKEDSSVLNDVGALFEKMYTDKGMENAFNHSLAQKYIAAEGLCIATASVDDAVIGFDAILYNSIGARLWMTAFDFRNEQNDSQLLSRAHQNLDWQMLMWCKQQGIEAFDFGGVNSFENPNGIAKFKMAFNGEPVTYNNVIAANSPLGYVAVTAMKLKGKIRRKG